MYTFTQPLTRALDIAAGSCAVVTDFAAAHGVTLIPGTQSRALIICKLQAALGHGILPGRVGRSCARPPRPRSGPKLPGEGRGR
jgi:hypothetical protein